VRPALHTRALSSHAANEALQLLKGSGLGFAGSSIAPGTLAHDVAAWALLGFKKLDGLRGTLDERGGASRPDCRALPRISPSATPVWE
jgi:hypothetical protein